MKAYQITSWGGPLEENEVAMPEPKGHEVLVKITACGICHSDIHIWDGYFDLGGGNKIDLPNQRGLKLPFTLGHEPVGEVVAIGDQVQQANIGQHAVVYPWIGCGSCHHCTDGEELLCAAPRTVGTRIPGGYAEYLLVPHEKYIVSHDGVPKEVAATAACSGITAYSALKKLREYGSDATILLIGAGGVGLSGVGMAKAVTGAHIVVADMDPAKRTIALEHGADEVIDNTDPNAITALIEKTQGGVQGVVDFVGAPATTKFGFSVLAKGGKHVVVGLYGGSVELSTPLFPLKVNTIQGSYVGTKQDLVELLDLIRQGKVKTVPVEPRHLSEAPQAIQDLRDGKAKGRYVLVTE